jgi:hypothetical protein
MGGRIARHGGGVKMYKEPLVDEKTNKIVEIRIRQEIDKKVAAIRDENNINFLSNLHDLCVLNRMRDSHKED